MTRRSGVLILEKELYPSYKTRKNIKTKEENDKRNKKDKMKTAKRKANEMKDLSIICPVWSPDQESYLRKRISDSRNAPKKAWSRQNDEGETEWYTREHLAEECYLHHHDLFADKTLQQILTKIEKANMWMGKIYTSSWHPTQTEYIHSIVRKMNANEWRSENGDELKPKDVAKLHEKDDILSNKNLDQISKKIKNIHYEYKTTVSMFWNFTRFTNQLD